jgi:LytR cell envelope-related transcriptional attenuator
VSYTVDPGAPAYRSRRRRAAITLSATVLLLFFAFWYALSYYRASTDPEQTASPACQTAIAAVKAKDVTLNVYNATTRNGLAAATAKLLRDRGIRVATVANDPLSKSIKGVAEVRYGRSGAAAAKVVLPLVPGAKRVQDGRPDGTVDIVLGQRFVALAASPTTSATGPTGGCP